MTDSQTTTKKKQKTTTTIEFRKKTSFITGFVAGFAVVAVYVICSGWRYDTGFWRLAESRIPFAVAVLGTVGGLASGIVFILIDMKLARLDRAAGQVL